jgi:hypothetical protein
MRYLRFILLPLLLIACTETQAPLNDTPQFNAANPPAESGIVVRDDLPIAGTWIDVKAELRVVVGADMLEFCAGIIDFDLVPHHMVFLPGGRDVFLYKGPMYTTVWPFLDFDCDLFTTVTPLAAGYADVVNTDNDPFSADANTANPYGFMAHGTLTRPSGEDALFSGHWRALWDYDLNEPVVLSQKIRLK